MINNQMIVDKAIEDRDIKLLVSSRDGMKKENWGFHALNSLMNNAGAKVWHYAVLAQPKDEIMTALLGMYGDPSFMLPSGEGLKVLWMQGIDFMNEDGLGLPGFGTIFPKTTVMDETGMFIAAASFGKLAKRLSFLFWENRNFCVFPANAQEHVTIAFTEVEENEKILVDGAFVCSATFGARLGMNPGQSGITRIITPSGQIKGRMIVSADDIFASTGTHLIVDAENVKTEIFTTDGSIWATSIPEKGGTNVSTSISSMSTLPELFIDASETDADLRSWHRAKIKRGSDEIKSGKAPYSIMRLMANETEYNSDGEAIESDNSSLADTALGRFKAFDDAGVLTTMSPFLMRDLREWGMKTLGQSMRDDLAIRFPVEFALRCKVVSATIAIQAGLVETSPASGEIKTLKGFKFVVEDEDYKRLMETHGGADGDDTFVLMLRNIGGKFSIIVYRDPIGRGEWSEWDLAKNSWLPYQFRDKRTWPTMFTKPISRETLDSMGMLNYTGFVVEPQGEVVESHFITFTEAWAGFKATVAAASVVGQVVNIDTILLQLKMPIAMVCSRETAIDTCTQGDSPERVKELLDWVGATRKIIINELRGIEVVDGKPLKKDVHYSIDRALLQKLVGDEIGTNAQGEPFNRWEPLNSHIGPITSIIAWHREMFVRWHFKVTAWAFENTMALPTKFDMNDKMAYEMGKLQKSSVTLMRKRRRETKQKYLTYSDWSAIGDEMMGKLNTHTQMGRARLLLAWRDRNISECKKVEEVLLSDKQMVNGMILGEYVKALAIQQIIRGLV